MRHLLGIIVGVLTCFAILRGYTLLRTIVSDKEVYDTLPIVTIAMLSGLFVGWKIKGNE